MKKTHYALVAFIIAAFLLSPVVIMRIDKARGDSISSGEVQSLVLSVQEKSPSPVEQKTTPAIRLCPTCGRPMNDEWQFCPYDGTELLDENPIPHRTPIEVLYEFLKGVKEGNKEKIRQSVDLEGILEKLIEKGIEGLEELPEPIRKICAKKLPGPAAQAMIPALLDILVSKQMREVQTFPEDISIRELDMPYRTVIVDDNNAKLIYVDDPSSTKSISLIKKNGVWMISRLPGI